MIDTINMECVRFSNNEKKAQWNFVGIYVQQNNIYKILLVRNGVVFTGNRLIKKCSKYSWTK